MAAAVIGEGKKGRWATVKYLFEGGGDFSGGNRRQSGECG